MLKSIQKSIEDLIEKSGLNGEKYREARRKARKAGDEKGAIAYTKLY